LLPPADSALPPMTKFAHEFAQRLDRALTLANIAPDRGRTARVAALFDVNRETARLWLKGRTPSMAILQDMAVRLRVSLDWLATGHGPAPGGVAERRGQYEVGDSLELQLIGLIRTMSPKRKRALLSVLTTE
jgi:hypothetical protein